MLIRIAFTMLLIMATFSLSAESTSEMDDINRLKKAYILLQQKLSKQELMINSLIEEQKNSDGTVGYALKNNTVGSAQIRPNSIGSSEIAKDAVGSDEIKSGAIGSSEIATNAVGADEIATGAVGASEIATNAVGADEIAADAVGASEIAANAVDADELEYDALRVSGEHYKAKFNSKGDSKKTLTNRSNSMCFLVGVEFEDIDGWNERASCLIVASGNNWELIARLRVDDDSDAYCTARCLTW